MTKLNLYLLFIFLVSSNFFFSQQIKCSKDILPTQPKNKKAIPQAKTMQISVPRVSINYNWYTAINDWDYIDSTIYTYNSQGLVTNKINRDDDPTSSISYLYDSKGRMTETLTQYYNPTSYQWQNSSRFLNIYDSHDELIEIRNDSWNSTSNQWVISWGQKELITYNANNSIILQISQSWNSSLLMWEDNIKQTNYIYDSNGNIIQYDAQNYNGSNWENGSRYTFTYASNNSLTDYVLQNWDGFNYVNVNHYMNISWHEWTGDARTSSLNSRTFQNWGQPIGGQWNTTERQTFTYDAFGGNVETDENYINGTWINSDRYSDLYDNKFNYLGTRNEKWQINSNTWLVDYEHRITLSYDANNNITQSIWEMKYSSSTPFIYTEKKVYSDFNTQTGIVSYNNSDQIEISIFPNPFSSQCTFRFEKMLTENDLNLKVFDIFGKEVLQTKLSAQETQIERGNLTPGIYFYSVMVKTNTLAKGKLVLE